MTPTAERVLSVLSELAEVEEVKEDLEMDLFGLNVLDSMKTVELIVAVSRAFGIDITPSQFDREQWATPGKIIAYVEGRVRP